MIALKKLYGEELLRLALMLSLLRADPEQYLRDDARILAGGLVNGTDWAPEIEGLISRPRYLHPKSLDSILLDYERDVFEELQALGRWGNAGATREAIQAYLLNGVENNNVQQVAAPLVQPNQDDSMSHYSIATNQLENENVEQCVTIKTEDEDSLEDVEEDVKLEFQESSPSATNAETTITLSASFIRNLTTFQGPLMEEDSAQSVSFDVSQFFANPLPIVKDEFKQEVKTEGAQSVDFFDDDNAIDDYMPFYIQGGGDSITNQNLADLTDFDETAETLKEFKKSIEFLDVKQQQENFDKYLIENTDLEAGEAQAVCVKRERASTSFTSVASSSGFGDDAYASGSSSSSDESVLTRDVEIFDDNGDKLTQEDMDLIEVLWKQDVDIGFSLNSTDALEQSKCLLAETGFSQLDASCTSLDIERLRSEELDEIDRLKDALKSSCETEESQAQRADSPELGTEADDLWAGLQYTVDTETGEYVLSSDLPSGYLLEDALQLVDIEDNTRLEDLKTPGDSAPASQERPAPEPEEQEGQEQQAEVEEMLAGRYGGPGGAHHAHLAHQHHHHHHQQHQQHLAAAYHHQNLVRSMSMEQRWQDLATLLALPAPHAAQQHEQHDLYHQHLGHGPQMSPGYVVPPYAPLSSEKSALGSSTDIYGSANLGSAVAASMNIQHNSQQQQQPHPPAPPPPPPPFYKAEQHEQEQCYYQNTTSELNATSDGFLSSILNDEDLQLMDMAMNEGMYTMRMLESGAAGGGGQLVSGAAGGGLGGGGPHQASVPHHHHLSQHHQPMLTHHMPPMGSERIDASSDSAVSSMGSERVPSLSDSEWCDGGSDSAQDYHGKMRACEVESRQPPLVAQKKHHMFGKRSFQDQGASVIRPRPGVEPSLPLHPALKFEYEQPTLPAASYAPDVGHITPEMKYSCTMEFSSGLGTASSGARHNHTYSLPPAPPQPPHRPIARDKRGRRGGEMGVGSCSGSGPLSRDEKRARALGVAGIPLSVHDIINLPMDEFNERLSKHDLSETQLSLIRDIRRRGKNKVAAQNCRKRKLDQITSLADEVRDARNRKQRLQREHQSLLGERQRTKEHFAALYRHVFQHLRDSEGNPLSSQQYSLQQAADGAVVLVPRSQGSLHTGTRSPNAPDRHMSTNGTSEDEMERIKLKQRKSFDQ